MDNYSQKHSTGTPLFIYQKLMPVSSYDADKPNLLYVF